MEAPTQAEPPALSAMECQLGLGTFPHPGPFCSVPMWWAKELQELPLGGLQMVINHEQSGKWHETHDTVHIETFHNCLKSQSPVFSLSTLPPSPLHHHELIPLSQSSLICPQLSQIHSLQFRCFPQRRKRFKAQDSRCTVKVGSTQLRFVLGELGAPGHHGFANSWLKRRSSEFTQWF